MAKKKKKRAEPTRKALTTTQINSGKYDVTTGARKGSSTLPTPEPFAGLKDVCPELVAVIDSVLTNRKGGRSLLLLQRYAEAAAAIAKQLVDDYGPNASIKSIANVSFEEYGDKGFSPT